MCRKIRQKVNGEWRYFRDCAYLAIEMSKWAILLLFIISYVSNGLGIKCWSCRSSDDPKCGDPFDNSTLPFANCNQQGLEKLPETKNSVCRKIRQKVNGDWNYIRDCAYIDVDIQVVMGGIAILFSLQTTGSFSFFKVH
ncbi:unnamed protein product, partial [Iphiclides podalirius]